jgi:hypothetical protein
VASIYGAMPGESGKHFADALLANFSLTIAHSCDPVSAHFLASKLGKHKELLFGGGSSGRQELVWDQLYGRGQSSASFNEQITQVLDERHFMIGRTGGPQNDYRADAYLIRSGEPFANGESFLRLAFSQKG